MSNDINLLGELLGVLSNKIIVPTGYHSRCSVIKSMMEDDMTGLISGLLNFQINAASVAYSIETDSPELTKILNKFLNEINSAYLGKIPTGVNALSKEYYNERWLSSGFTALKIAQWEKQGSLELPSKMFVVDGASIYAKDRDTDSQRSLLQYDYYLGKSMKNKLSSDIIFNRPYGRWFSKYPTPYLIKTGTYHNFSIIKSLKAKQSTVLDQVIPYLFLIKRGSELLDREGITYNDEKLAKVIEQYKVALKDVKAGKTPTRATNWDEEISQIIPDMKNIFSPELFQVAERSILSGLGFLDIAESVSSSRKESVLNPKPFISEVSAGIEGFKEILRSVVNLIRLKNSKNVKYMNADIRVVSSPVMAFQTDEFKKMIRSIFKAGRISSQTAIEICGELDYNTEKARILKEKKENIDEKFYPPITENQVPKPEDKGNEPPKKIDKDNLPDDKTDPIEKKEYKNASINIAKKDDLLGAPYRNLSELPKNIQKFSKKYQRAFQKSWNKTYYWAIGKGKSKKQAEKLAFRIANSVINKLKKKSKK